MKRSVIKSVAIAGLALGLTIGLAVPASAASRWDASRWDASRWAGSVWG